MKKILIIGPFPDPITGQSIANETIYNGLSEKYNVDKIDTVFDRELTNKNLQGKFNIKKISITLIRSLKEIIKIIKGKYDVVYMTPGGTYLGFMRFMLYIMAASMVKARIFIHNHNGSFGKMYEEQSDFREKSLKFLLKKVTGVIVLGDSLRYMFKGLVPEEKIYVCENGVQDEFVATEKEIEDKRNRMKKDTKQRVLYLSNLMEEKGILDLLKASEAFSEDEIEFNLAGAIEPSIKDQIEGYLEKYPNKIKYHGIVRGKEKKKLLLDNYIFILPTYYSIEGQPISILEAYTNGCAVITTDQGGIGDIFKDKVNGIKCQKRDKESLVQAIKYIKINMLKNIERNYELALRKYTKTSFLKRLEKTLWRF